MRLVIFLMIASMSFSVYSQQATIAGFLTEIGRSTDGLVKACLLVNKNGYGTELLIYKNGKNWDTLSIVREGDSDIGDTCFIQTVQIDKKGLKEVVLSWSGQGSHSYGGPTGGGFSNKFTKHEIWNLNTGKKLFAAQSLYYNQESLGYYSEKDPSELKTRTETCSYQYTFAVTKDGKVVISNLKQKNSSPVSKPDHKPGVYLFRDDQFVRQ